jgi:hypothetical protein
MNYQAFTNESLTMMYAAVRGALNADDAVERQGGEPKFKVRDTPDWKKHAADLEAEMLRRGMLFEVIDWFEGHEALPFDRLRPPFLGRDRTGPASFWATMTIRWVRDRSPAAPRASMPVFLRPAIGKPLAMDASTVR